MTSNSRWPYRLLTPGPVPLHPEVQKILAEPMLHHRTPQFEKTLQKVLTGLKEVFGTQNPVFIHTSTGSGAMESALVNTLSCGDSVLCIVSGKFGERWAQMAKVYGLVVEKLEVPWGESVSVDLIKKKLEENPKIQAVLCQACETSTATIHPIQEIAAVIQQKPNTLFIVDAITAVGSMPIEMDAWGLDVVIGGSQKAFMLPTGMSFIALSEKAWEKAQLSNLPKYYWDLKQEKKSLEQGETHFSSNVSLIRALELTLPHLTGEKKSQTLNRIQALAQATRSAFTHLNFSVFSQSPSPSVTALKVPNTVDGQKLRSHLEKAFNITVMGGQDQLKGKVLRIGHLGFIEDQDMLALIEACYESLKYFHIALTEWDYQKARTTYLEEIQKNKL